jgi:hypothetical protein
MPGCVGPEARARRRRPGRAGPEAQARTRRLGGAAGAVALAPSVRTQAAVANTSERSAGPTPRNTLPTHWSVRHSGRSSRPTGRRCPGQDCRGCRSPAATLLALCGADGRFRPSRLATSGAHLRDEASLAWSTHWPTSFWGTTVRTIRRGLTGSLPESCRASPEVCEPSDYCPAGHFRT